MGAHLSRVLANQGNKVDVTSRREIKDACNIHYIKGNAHDDKFVKTLLVEKQYDAVVDFMAYGTAEFAARHSMMLNGTRQYVYLSSSRAYADSETPIKEDVSPRLIDSCKDAEYLSTDEYALGKGRQENILRGSGNSNWTIIRPYITYSEIRLQLGVLEKEQWLWRALHGRTIVFSKDVADKYTTLTYGLNVAEAMAAVIGNEAAMGEAFHITCDYPCKWSEILQIYLDAIENAMGFRPKVLMIDQAVNLQLSHRKWQVKYYRLFNRRFDNSKINRFYDTSSFLTAKDGLTKCLTYFCQHQQWRAIDVQREALYDRITNEWATTKDFKSTKTYAKYLFYRVICPQDLVLRLSLSAIKGWLRKKIKG